jgi:hypothetical protein
MSTNMNAEPLHLPHWPHDGVQGLRRELRAWWWDVPGPLRSRGWPLAFALLTILALLISFHQVVRNAVQQGEILRMSAASRAEAMAQCQALRNARVRGDCIKQVDAPPLAQIDTTTPPDTASLEVAQIAR